MRKEARRERTVATSRVQSYHERDYTQERNSENYAFQGYNKNYFFASDRKHELDNNFKPVRNDVILKGYGIEFELECNGINGDDRLANVLDKTVFNLFPADLFKMQHDGSLGCGYASSCEAITQVMSKGFIRNNYRNFKAMYNEYFPLYDITCSSGHCGMHVNISTACFGQSEAAQEEAIRKLYYIINKHFSLCCALFNRKEEQTGYCSQMDPSEAWTMNLHHQYSDHHVSFNLGHYDAGRIEIRLVGGQKNYACFRNTMESIFHLVERVKTISRKDCDNVVKVFRGCNQYVYDRLVSKCANARAITSEQLTEIALTVKDEELL